KYSNTWALAASTKRGLSRWVSARETCANRGVLGSGAQPAVKLMLSRIAEPTTLDQRVLQSYLIGNRCDQRCFFRPASDHIETKTPIRSATTRPRVGLPE